MNTEEKTIMMFLLGALTAAPNKAKNLLNLIDQTDASLEFLEKFKRLEDLSNDKEGLMREIISIKEKIL